MIYLNVPQICVIGTFAFLITYHWVQTHLFNAHLQQFSKDIFDLTTKHNDKFLQNISTFLMNNEQNIINIMMSNKREQEKNIADIRLNLAKLKGDIK